MPTPKDLHQSSHALTSIDPPKSTKGLTLDKLLNLSMLQFLIYEVVMLSVPKFIG